MKYRGFEIERIPGFDCRPPKKGEGSEWVSVETKVGTTYQVNDPQNGDKKMWAENTLKDAKESIDALCNKYGWQVNPKAI